MQTFLEAGSQTSKFVLAFSSVFLHQKTICYLHPLFFELRTEDWAVQSAVCLQCTTRQESITWLSVQGTGTYSWTHVFGRKEPEGSGEYIWGENMQSMYSVHQWYWKEFSPTSKNNWIITSKDFSTSSVNKPVNPPGTDQRKRPMLMDSLGIYSTRSSTLCGNSRRRYKQHPSPGTWVNICFFTARQTLFWHYRPQNQKCGC